jgi:hypothetical protein
MNQSGFIAPVKQFAHGAAVGSGDHESPHIHLGSPEGCGPEGGKTIAQQPGCEIAVGARGLPRGSEGVEKEHRKKTPGANAKTSDGDKRHGYQFGRLTGGASPKLALVLRMYSPKGQDNTTGSPNSFKCLVGVGRERN